MENETGTRRFDRKAWALFALTMAFASVLFFARLGTEPYMDYDEATYAEIVRDTPASGDLMTLRILHDTWFEKPPLYFWTAMASQKAFGETEFAMRLPSAVFGLLSVALVWLLAWRYTGDPRVSAFAGAILATTGAFVDAGRQGRTDMMIAFFLLLSFYCFVRGLAKRQWFLGFGASIGLAIMTKSILGLLAYPFAIIVAIAERKTGWLKDKWFWAGQAIAALIAVPWHWHMIAKHGSSFTKIYFFEHLFERYETDIIGNGASAFTYLDYLRVYASPWALVFAILCIFLLFPARRRSLAGLRPIGMFFATALFLFAFFEASKTKIVFYLVPMYPFVALSIALFAGAFLRTDMALRRKKLFAGALALLLVSGTVTAIERGFHLDDRLDIEHRFSYDQREIGLILKGIPDANPVYFLDPLYQQAVRYYGGGKLIDDLVPGGFYDKPIYVVAFTYKLDSQSLAPLAAKRLYAGEYFSLVKFGPGQAPESFE